MKILILSCPYPNIIKPTYGIFISERVRFLKKYCNIKIIAPVPYFPRFPFFKKWSEYSNIPKYEIVDGIEIFHPRFLLFPKNFLRRHIGFLLYLTLKKKLKKIKKGFNFDLIHAHFSVHSGIAVSYLSKKNRVPFIITEHYGKLHEDLHKNSKIRNKVKNVFTRATHIIAVSERIKQNLIDSQIDPNKVSVITNGVDTEKFPLIDNKFSEPIQLLSIGGLIKPKGFEYIIKAVKILIEKGIDVELKIIGEGVNRESLNNLIIDNQLQKIVHLVGNIPHQDLWFYFKTTHIFVLSSISESFSVVTIEALSSGIPVIVTRCGGPEYFVNDEVGLIVEKENSEQIVQAIERMIKNYSKYNPKSIRKYCIENFDYNKITMQIFQVYQSIVREKKNA